MDKSGLPSLICSAKLSNLNALFRTIRTRKLWKVKTTLKQLFIVFDVVTNTKHIAVLLT